MQLLIDPGGTIRCLYDEALDLRALGSLAIRRGSHVEPDRHGRWFADMSPVKGPKLGPFPCRSEALAAERRPQIDHHYTTARRPVADRVPQGIEHHAGANPREVTFNARRNTARRCSARRRVISINFGSPFVRDVFLGE